MSSRRQVHESDRGLRGPSELDTGEGIPLQDKRLPPIPSILTFPNCLPNVKEVLGTTENMSFYYYKVKPSLKR